MTNVFPPPDFIPAKLVSLLNYVRGIRFNKRTIEVFEILIKGEAGPYVLAITESYRGNNLLNINGVLTHEIWPCFGPFVSRVFVFARVARPLFIMGPHLQLNRCNSSFMATTHSPEISLTSKTFSKTKVDRRDTSGSCTDIYRIKY